MKKMTMRRCLSILTVLLLCMSIGAQGHFYQAEPTFAVTDQDLNDLDKEIKAKEKKLKEGKKEEKEMMQSIVDLEEKIGDLDAEIDNAQQDLEVLTKDLKKAQKAVKRQNRDLSKRLRAMYKNGSVGFMDVLLHSGSFSDFLTNLDMVQRILANDEEVLKDLEKAHKRIAKKKKEVEELEAELTSARATASYERNEVQQQKEALTRANKQTADDIGDLEAEREALEAKLAAQSQAGEISNSGTSKYSGGAFLWPLPSSSNVTSNYGWRNCPFHGREFHAAIDIGAASGADIVAAASGKVIQAGWYGGFGNSVIIDHGGGLSSQYNHCSSVYVSYGQKVKRGDSIAAVGSTGFSTGPHLDFRVYKDGSAVSPWNYLQ